MPVTFSVHVTCDGCDEEFPDDPMEEVVNGDWGAGALDESALETHGWTCDNMEILCPKCVEEREEEGD